VSRLKVDGAITGKWQEVFEAVVYKPTKYLYCSSSPDASFLFRVTVVDLGSACPNTQMMQTTAICPKNPFFIYGALNL
jgi:hypothetical protein